jgi:hypothetical protein
MQPGCVTDIAMVGFGLAMYFLGRATEWFYDWLERDHYYRNNVP